ncbi:MAG TPA: CDP-diacylglycerol--serine O-phosphatidyltransferase [Candidatus Dormibacteraeota bacterium]|nr:CDP-diacylglycerol--serine O-phosphatidyltransferase [Candidatus Dormibacteraeota bacterium]
MDFNFIDPIGHDDEPRKPVRNGRLRRGVYVLPSILTVANLLCGYYAILATLEGQTGDLDNAARAIGFAIIFDSLDGRVARAMGTNSEFGKQFDSLADVISFGIAPAFLAYAWGVRISAAATGLTGAAHLIQLGWLIGFFYLCCCAWRLARFNIQGMAQGGSRFFAGMPTPAAAGMIAAVVHFVKNPIENPTISVLWLVLVAVLGVLMSSTIRYYSFKDIQWTRRWPSLSVVAIAMLVGAVWFFSQYTLLVIAGAYTVHGLVLQAVRVVRHRTASRHA